MLHSETIEPGTLSVLKKLMALPKLNDFSLVGGTALSLKFGHRKSIDIDIFSNKIFEQKIVIKAIESEYKSSFNYRGGLSKIGIFCFIEKVKVDIVHYPHPLISPVIEIDGIRMYSDNDIVAMKLNALLGRGVKKDFWDIYELLHHYSLEQMMEWHKQKYPNQMLLISIPQALIYFEDADKTEDPVSLKNQNWESVKKYIAQKVDEYLK